MKTNTGYNGWKNRATWNISLWLNNDEGLYNLMCDYVQGARDKGGKGFYTDFIRKTGLEYERTPDGFKFDGKALDRKALTEMLREV